MRSAGLRIERNGCNIRDMHNAITAAAVLAILSTPAARAYEGGYMTFTALMAKLNVSGDAAEDALAEVLDTLRGEGKVSRLTTDYGSTYAAVLA